MHGPEILEIRCRSVQTQVDKELGSPAKQKRDILPRHQNQYRDQHYEYHHDAVGRLSIVLTRVPSSHHRAGSWKARYPARCAGLRGYDSVDTMIALGADAMKSSPFAVGDRVVGMAHGMNKLQPNVGAVAEYMGPCADLLLKVSNSIGFEEAACLGSRLLRQLWTFLLSCVCPQLLNSLLHLQVLMEKRRICRSGIHPNSRFALKTTSQASLCPALHQTCMHWRRANAKWT